MRRAGLRDRNIRRDSGIGWPGRDPARYSAVEHRPKRIDRGRWSTSCPTACRTKRESAYGGCCRWPSVAGRWNAASTWPRTSWAWTATRCVAGGASTATSTYPDELPVLRSGASQIRPAGQGAARSSDRGTSRQRHEDLAVDRRLKVCQTTRALQAGTRQPTLPPASQPPIPKIPYEH